MSNNNSENLKDIDGNIYQTVKIGDQIWMAENLKVSHFINGDPIPEIGTDFASNEEWVKVGIEKKPTWCYHQDFNDNGKTYGKLYNGHSVTDPRGIAPNGWHIPTDEEWKTLEMFLGMNESDIEKEDWRGDKKGDMLKEEGSAHWDSQNNFGNNKSGFTALPGGYRDYGTGNWGSIYFYAGFWSATIGDDSNSLYYRLLHSSGSKIRRLSSSCGLGFSIRLIKD